MSRSNEEEGRPPKLALIASHGGHLTEMESLRRALAEVDSIVITYASPRTSERNGTYCIRNIGSNPLRLLLALIQMALILAKEKPQAIISTGAEIAIPAFLLGKLLGLRLIFVESLCRVSQPSGTGFLLYPLADLFFVQWPQLAKSYGRRAVYAGAVL